MKYLNNEFADLTCPCTLAYTQMKIHLFMYNDKNESFYRTNY